MRDLVLTGIIFFGMGICYHFLTMPYPKFKWDLDSCLADPGMSFPERLELCKEKDKYNEFVRNGASKKEAEEYLIKHNLKKEK